MKSIATLRSQVFWRFHFAIPLAIFLYLSMASSFAEERISDEDLMLYRTGRGEVQPVKSVSDWEQRRRLILAEMQEVMGALPGAEKRTPLNMEVLDETDCGSYLRLAIVYEPEPNSRLPAYLLVPKKAFERGEQLPGVLCLHPTSNEYGKKVVVGLSPHSNRNYAHELAERGYVALAPAYPLLAEYQPDLKALGYESGTMKAIWDNIRSLDLLDSLSFVKHRRYGAIGHSLGGHNALFTAAFDPRIQVVVSSCGFDSFQDYMDGQITGWTSERYMPKLLEYPLQEIPFDFHEVIGAIAPRVCFVSAPFYDSNFKWRSVYRIEEAASKVYQLYGASSRFVVEHPSCGHDFPQEMREKAYALFDQHLR